MPKEYVPGVLKGLQESMDVGSLAGFPVVDVAATLTDGSYHEVDSSALAFQVRSALLCTVLQRLVLLLACLSACLDAACFFTLACMVAASDSDVCGHLAAWVYCHRHLLSCMPCLHP